MENFQCFFLQNFVGLGLIFLKSLALDGVVTLVYTALRNERQEQAIVWKTEPETVNVAASIISLTSRSYLGYDLYMLTASDSEKVLLVLPFLTPAPRHDSHGLLYSWFSIKKYHQKLLSII